MHIAPAIEVLLICAAAFVAGLLCARLLARVDPGGKRALTIFLGLVALGITLAARL